MTIFLVSSKYGSEYSGSGLRAENTYKRLNLYHGISKPIILANSETIKFLTFAPGFTRIGPILPSKFYFFRLINASLIIILTLLHFVLNLPYVLRGNALLHTFGDSWSVTVYTILFSLLRKPIVREVVNDVSTVYYPSPLKKVIKFLLQYGQCSLVTISPRLHHKAISEGFLEQKIWSRPNPVEAKFFLHTKKSTDKLRAELGIKPNQKLCVQIASFQDKKNQLFLVKTFSFLPSNYRLVLAGPVNDQLYFDTVKAEVEDLNLRSRISFIPGFYGKPELLMSAADVYLFPSKSEGLGTPLLESICCGTPVVANHIPGITDYFIVDGLDGYQSTLNEPLFASVILQCVDLPPFLDDPFVKSLILQSRAENIDEHYRNILKPYS